VAASASGTSISTGSPSSNRSTLTEWSASGRPPGPVRELDAQPHDPTRARAALAGLVLQRLVGLVVPVGLVREGRDDDRVRPVVTQLAASRASSLSGSAGFGLSVTEYADSSSPSNSSASRGCTDPAARNPRRQHRRLRVGVHTARVVLAEGLPSRSASSALSSSSPSSPLASTVNSASGSTGTAARYTLEPTRNVVERGLAADHARPGTARLEVHRASPRLVPDPCRQRQVVDTPPTAGRRAPRRSARRPPEVAGAAAFLPRPNSRIEGHGRTA